MSDSTKIWGTATTRAAKEKRENTVQAATTARTTTGRRLHDDRLSCQPKRTRKKRPRNKKDFLPRVVSKVSKVSKVGKAGKAGKKGKKLPALI